MIALDCVNVTRDHMQGRLLVTEGAGIDPVRLADKDEPLKDMARQVSRIATGHMYGGKPHDRAVQVPA